MPTLSDLIIRVRRELAGFSQNQQQWSYLTAPISPSDTTLTVADATQISRGMIEVDGSELMLVKSVNQQTNQLTIDPFARGWDGSTATSHSANASVENNPQWPAVRVKEAINDAIRGVYPRLWATNTTSIPKISVVYQYGLPADAEEIISVQYQLIGPSHVWPFARNWRFVGQSNIATGELGSTGKSVFVGDDITPGRQIFVTYRKEPTELTNSTDDFATVTGLPSTSHDVIVWGACQKLAPQLEGPRLTLNAVEASERAQYVQPGSASRVSQYFGQLYAQRLEEEAAKQRDRFQIPSHYDF
ncbi:MAG TPA: hypothetical protein VFK47_15320 [Ktedonobacteraceae bacterium]|nr:hypothetical protein [Ktedonobacteraceae bacterium]